MPAAKVQRLFKHKRGCKGVQSQRRDIRQYLHSSLHPLLPQVIILVQLAVVAVMMCFFSAYHMWLVAVGKTTYETSKWRRVRLAAYNEGAPQPW